jgi:hypothetical protein
VLITGIRGHQVQKCSKCYTVSRDVEDGRNITTNYAMKNKLFPDSHYKQVIKSAADKGLPFEITFEEFKNTVSLPCKYCKIYNEHESIGIDRIDSSKGYILDNIVPCCTICNMCKGTLSILEFKTHIIKLAREFEKEEKNEIIQSTALLLLEPCSLTKKSYIRPGKVVELYLKGKLSEYIQVCINDTRSPIFIKKLEDINVASSKLTAAEFKKQLTNALFSETRAKLLTESESRKRIPRKELFGYMNTHNSKELIKVYEQIFGKVEGFEYDINMLNEKWDTLSDSTKKVELEKVLIKYQNKRAAAAYKERNIQKAEIARGTPNTDRVE